MTTATLSVYPPAVEELLPAARRLAEQRGDVPSRNELMRALKIGAPKATTLRQALADFATDVEAAEPDASTVDTPATVEEPQPVVEPVAPERPSRLDDPFLPLIDPDLDVHVVAVPLVPVPILPPASPEPEALPAPHGHPALNITKPTENPAFSAVAPGWRLRWPLARDGSPARARTRRRLVTWPVLPLALPAFVAIWSGWVELGQLAGFGMVRPLPGIIDDFQINSAITLPIGVETYAAYALYVWLSGRAPKNAHLFAMWSAIGSLLFGAAGQIAYHLLVAAGVTSAPWEITSAVACLPVLVLGMGAALAHLLRADKTTDETGAEA